MQERFELAALYERFMLMPRRGPGVCASCFNLTAGSARCYACAHGERWLDAMAPISYSIAREQLHFALASYKRLNGEMARRLWVELAAILWRYLEEHERCLARALQVGSFDLVTTVPSGLWERDAFHPLRVIVGELVGPVRERHERLLRRSRAPSPAHGFDAKKYLASRPLDGETVLLVDDTWTTGANAHSAAAALKAAGAGPVAAVVIGRHLNRDYNDNDRRLRELATPFEWDRCALCSDYLAGTSSVCSTTS